MVLSNWKMIWPAVLWLRLPHHPNQQLAKLDQTSLKQSFSTRCLWALTYALRGASVLGQPPTPLDHYYRYINIFHIRMLSSFTSVLILVMKVVLVSPKSRVPYPTAADAFRGWRNARELVHRGLGRRLKNTSGQHCIETLHYGVSHSPNVALEC